MNGNNDFKRNPQSKKDFYNMNTSSSMATLSSGFSRERSFIRPNNHQQQFAYQIRNGYNNNNNNFFKYKRNNSSGSIVIKPKTKPTMEIYRPPSLRNESKLNANAKEFVMKSNQANFNTVRNNNYIQQSKSGSNLIKVSNVPQQHYHYNYNQQQINFHQNQPNGSKMVHFNIEDNNNTKQNKANFKLKRSKSTGTANVESITTHLENFSIHNRDQKNPDLGPLPDDIKDNLKNVLNGPNNLPSNKLIHLAQFLVSKSYESRQYSIPVAKTCIDIIQNEKNSLFLESLLNICQKTYQDKDKILKVDNLKMIAFMWFLTEMCLQLKRSHVTKKQILGNPFLTFLKILAKCCQSCVEPPIRSLNEIECLFYVLTSIGRDLEKELPVLLENLWSRIRDGFFDNDTSQMIKKTLLQLIEFRASKWQLSGTTVLFYYPERK